MIKAIIWDMDGVIVDSETHYHIFEKEFLKRLGIETEDQVLRNFMGTPFSHYFPILAKEYGSTKSLEEAQDEYVEFIAELYQKHVELTPHLKQVFDELSRDYQFGLATSSVKKLASIALDRFGLLNFFKVRIHGDEIKNGKPDPEIFLKVLSSLGFKPNEVLVVEDSYNGIKAGKAAGMKVIAYKAAHNKDIDFSLAEFVVEDLREIPRILTSLRGGAADVAISINQDSDASLGMTYSYMTKTVGIIGGGQLGRMMTEASKNLDLKIMVLEPTENPPAVQASAEQIVGGLTDPVKIKELAEKSDYLTWEIEHINTEILEELESKGFKINPSPKTLATIKDKYLQKEFLRENGIPTAVFKKVQSIEDIKKAAEELGMPLILKTRFGGYDGRGNFVIHNEEDIEEGFMKLGGKDLYVEGWVDFKKELAVMAVRDVNANIKSYPVVETIHENNILQVVLAPAPIPSNLIKKAEDFAKKVLEHLGGAGVFGIEMFLTKSGEILVNEIAPRVHNSGHYTIEACETSQFENQLRAVSEMELGDTSMKVGAAVMVNILGDRNGVADPKGIQEAEKLGNVFVHIYGKKDVKVERKMGHLTVVGENLDEVLEKANKARSLISI